MSKTVYPVCCSKYKKVEEIYSYLLVFVQRKARSVHKILVKMIHIECRE